MTVLISADIDLTGTTADDIFSSEDYPMSLKDCYFLFILNVHHCYAAVDLLNITKENLWAAVEL